MNTLTGALTSKQAYKEHDAKQALQIYACLRDYCLPIEVQDMLVDEVTHINVYDTEGKKHGLWKEWRNDMCHELVYQHGELRIHMLTVRGKYDW